MGDSYHSSLEETEENSGSGFSGKPLHVAASNGKIEDVRELLAQGADINAKDKVGWTPLFNAAAYGRVEILRELIAQGAEINALDRGGGTPLWRSRNHPEVVSLLLQAGADPRMHEHGWTSAWDWARMLGRVNGMNRESEVVAAMIDEAGERLEARERREALLNHVSSAGVDFSIERIAPAPTHTKLRF